MEDIEAKFEEYGLVDVQKLEPSIKVNLKYSSEDNFMKRNMYVNLDKAYLIPELAKRLVRVQRKLKAYNEKLSIVIFDAARPLSIQRLMYETVKNTPQAIYVADPTKNGGFHNYAMAVDLTITHEIEGDLDMGSCFDYFGAESHVGLEVELYKNKQISFEAVKNRFFLYTIMMEEELFPYCNEWWHYQYHQNDEDKAKFRLLNF